MNFWIIRYFVNYIEICFVRVLIWHLEPALVMYGQKIMNRFFKIWIPRLSHFLDEFIFWMNFSRAGAGLRHQNSNFWMNLIRAGLWVLGMPKHSF